MFFFHPETLGKWSNFEEHIFQVSWFNHQVGMFPLLPRWGLEEEHLQARWKTRKSGYLQIHCLSWWLLPCFFCFFRRFLSCQAVWTTSRWVKLQWFLGLFTPEIGADSQFDYWNMFQMSWNHHLVRAHLYFFGGVRIGTYLGAATWDLRLQYLGIVISS